MCVGIDKFNLGPNEADFLTKKMEFLYAALQVLSCWPSILPLLWAYGSTETLTHTRIFLRCFRWKKSKKGTILALQDEKLTFYSFELQEVKEEKGENFTQQSILMKAIILINNSKIISM